MTDILKEKLEKEKLVEVETWTCGTCDGHFIILKDIPKLPFWCPYCRASTIGLNDELKIKIS